MVSRLTYKELISRIQDLGIEAGDTVHLQSSLAMVGPIEAGPSDQEMLDFYYHALWEVIGPNGTLLVHTPFEDYGRFGTPFIVEESPSRAGVFSEYVRTRAGAIRSIHPIVSTAGVGKNAELICGGNHYSGFGYDSSWGRMHRNNVKFLFLGVYIRKYLSFIHYIESVFNVPYLYTKIYPTPVYKNNVKIERQFAMAVRYLDFSIAWDITNFESILRQNKLINETKLGRSILQVCNAEEVFNKGMQCLSENMYIFLKNPPNFKFGQIPADGFTGPQPS
ncbi:MAG: AAC(3) family N-acetyltransferase [Chitinophagaceae bacterium]|nr:AAC(3) family N-acetyltransferase [Chitinophagaceae bacterium]